MKNKPYRLVIYVLLRISGYLLYPLPLKISLVIGAFIGRLSFFILSKERRRTLTHLKVVFKKTETEKEILNIAQKVFINLGKNAIEWLNFPKLDKKWFESHITSVGIERLYTASKKGKGVIILASHFGNWELLAAYLGLIGYKGAIVARKIYISQIDRLFVKIRRRMGHIVIYRDESPRRILQILKNGGYVGILPDQDVDSIDGIFVTFFGKPAYTPTSPVNLAIKTGAALIPMFLIRENGKFKFVVEEEISLEIGNDRERTLIVNTEKWMKVLEKYIRRYPDQWVWMHRRWKTRPKTVTAHQMELIDRFSQKHFNISSTTLMENAGREISSVATDILFTKKGATSKKKIAIFCGKGNNGGDGLVASRYLIKKGFDVTTYLLYTEEKLKKDPHLNLSLLKELRAKIVVLKNKDLITLKNELNLYDLIIDAIFGTGFKGRPDNFVESIINNINSSGVKTLSIDIPSGLDATTGESEGSCIRASETVSFGLPKRGLYESSGPTFAGRIIIKNIGFPEELLKQPPS